jgi:oxaloacetate decarboxylase beta subunit
MQELLKEFINIFPGIASFGEMSLQMGIVRVFLIFLGLFLCFLGYKKILDPLLMVPMGAGIAMVNAGILIMPHTGELGTMFLNAFVETPKEHIDAFQIYFLQPVYALTFSNGLIACIVFIGIGSITELDFFIANPKMSLLLALPAELGTILTFPIALMFGLTAAEAGAVAIIGGADGPMVLFASLQLAKHLFVPIAIVAYIYLSIIYAGYPFMIKALVPKHMRGVPMKDFTVKQVSSGEKIAFSIVTGSILCLLFPVASPLFASFFLGVIIRESKITRFITFTDDVCLSGATLFLGFTLGCLLSADTVLDPTLFKLIILGFIALFLSGLGGIAGGLLAYKVSGGRINPLLGIAGVSCIPTTAKVVHKCAQEVNPQAFILPYAMGPSIAGVITSAIIAACYITMIPHFGN